MNILLIDGSPRPTGSTSLYLLNALEERLGDAHNVSHAQVKREHDWEETAAALLGSEAVVFAFPLYVDSIPSQLLRFLEHMEPLLSQRQHRPQIFAIVNNGFYEAHQNRIALSIMKRWCDACKMPWGQGVAIGGGGMAAAAPIGKGPCTSHGKAFDALSETIQNGGGSEDLYSEPDFPRFLYKAAAHMNWRQTAKKNGLRASDLRKRHSYLS